MDYAQLTPVLTSLVLEGLREEGLRPPPAVLPEPAWMDLANLASAHGLAPLVHAGVKASGIEVPTQAGAALARQARAAALRAQNALDQLASLVSTLNGAGIEPMPLKGALLFQRGYRVPGHRPFADIDVLVPEDRREDAAAALCAHGYTQLPGTHGADPRQTEGQHHWAFRPERGLPVELHWALTDERCTVQLGSDAFMLRGESFACGEGRALAPSAGDHMLYLGVHAANHDFVELLLRSYVDAAVLADAISPSEWPAVWQRAEAAGARADLAVFLGVAAALGLLARPSEALPPCGDVVARPADLSALARCTVAYPFLEMPVALFDILSGDSPLRALLSLGRPRFTLSESQQGTAPVHVGRAAEGAARRIIRKLKRLPGEIGHVRAAARVRRRFRGRSGQ